MDDVDGDGMDDLVAGASEDSTLAAVGGAVFVFAGGFTGVVDAADADHAWYGDMTSEYLGNAVATPGDLDGDGYGDLVVVGPGPYSAYAYHGSAWVLLGPLASTGDIEADAAASIEGDGTDVPWTVDGAGDVNGDGLADVLFGAPLAGGYLYGMGYGWFYDSGEAQLFYGGTWSGALTTADADATWTSTTGEGAGIEVGGGHDLDADGYDDLVIGECYSPAPGGGAAHVVFGGP